MQDSGLDGPRIALAGSSSEVTAVVALRRQAYEASPEFQVRREQAFAWTETDTLGYVPVVWNAGNMALATMRGVVVSTRAEAEWQSECSVQLARRAFPALLLERAATKKERCLGGLNSLLRYHFIAAAMQAGLSSVVGAVFEAAPRVRLLAELGYEFSIPERVWDPNVAPRTRLLIARLANQHMPHALRLLEARLGPLLQRYPWRGRGLELRPCGFMPPIPAGLGELSDVS